MGTFYGLCVLLLVSFAGGSVLRSGGGFGKTIGQPWPMPQAYTSEPSTLDVDDTLTFTSNLGTCDVIAQAFQRYKAYMTQSECERDPGKRETVYSNNINKKLVNVNVQVKGVCEHWPTASSDEQYSIMVNTPTSQGKGLIEANTVWGALRALETLSQLVYEGEDGVNHINTTLVLDFPRFGFRGMMLDTSRHFLTVRSILENLEAMAQNKLNVFHWHIVDDQSFPYVSAAFPKLSQLGAYDSGHVYTPQDVAKVIEFARVRGIRVIPEFDSPGHTMSWGQGQEGLLTPCFNGGKSDGTFGPVNPILPTTYTFLQRFFQEVSSVFSDQYIHLGGDEVSFDCWKSNPDILNWMKARSMAQNFSKLETYYEQQVVNIMTGLRKNYIVWQEVFDNQVTLDKSTLIHIWKDGFQNELAAVTKAGFNTILSSCWYLNYIAYGNDWHPYYTCDPQVFNGTDAQKELVVGGAACMWGEYEDSVNMMVHTWPRASAVAERLWSASTLNDPNEAAERLEELRCRMMKRGLTVEPVNGPSFCKCDIFN